MIEPTLILCIGFILDLLLGDPRYPLHPVRVIGAFISMGERILFRFGRKTRQDGAALVCITLFVFPFCYVLLSSWLKQFHPILSFGFDLYICYSLLALGDLLRHVQVARGHLEKGDLEKARRSVAMIVGRDTRPLDRAGLARATVESLAENFVDGFFSPVFWFTVGGFSGHFICLSSVQSAILMMMVFKIISTFDSMIGYKSDKYFYFGFCGAILDDIMNFIPARMSLIILFIGSLISFNNPLNAFRVSMRDRLKHDSPNAAHAESFMAGALGIRLGGPTQYPEGLREKPWLGDGSPEVGVMHIRHAVKLVLCSSWASIIGFISLFLIP